MWHALAKLRLHTETTVYDLENSTTRLGKILRKFKSEVCPQYETKDLPSEEAARVRRKATQVKKVPTMPTSSKRKALPESNATNPKNKSHRHLNLTTYKLHSLGGYVRSIREHGTTDNTSSQTVNNFMLLLPLFFDANFDLGRVGTSSCEALLSPCTQGKACGRNCNSGSP
jgi:hypothetical protein